MVLADANLRASVSPADNPPKNQGASPLTLESMYEQKAAARRSVRDTEDSQKMTPIIAIRPLLIRSVAITGLKRLTACFGLLVLGAAHRALKKLFHQIFA